MTLFSNRYQKTGFMYSISLSFMYLPLLLGILENNQFIENQFCNLIVFISFFLTFITAMNYKIILSIQDKNAFFLSIYMLAPLNMLVMLITYMALPFTIERNMFILSVAFFITPWIVFFKWIIKRHTRSLEKIRA